MPLHGLVLQEFSPKWNSSECVMYWFVPSNPPATTTLFLFGCKKAQWPKTLLSISGPALTLKSPLLSIHTSSVDFSISFFPRPPRIHRVPFGKKTLGAYALATTKFATTSHDPLPAFPLGLKVKRKICHSALS